MLAELAATSTSVWTLLLIACIPAVITFIGVVFTVRHGQDQALAAITADRVQRTADRDHVAKLERDRFMRAERVTGYRSLIASAHDMLLWSSFDLEQVRDDGFSRFSAEASAKWALALAEAQLIAARTVVTAAEQIDAVRNDRLSQIAMRRAMIEMLDNYSEPPETKDRRRERLDLISRLFEENKVNLANLRDVCRQDMAALDD